MSRFLTLFLIVSITSCFSQGLDSSFTKVSILPDTTFIQTDSLLASDSLLTIVKRDSIAPIYSLPLSENSFIIKNNDLLRLDYKYTGDYLKLFPFNFIKDLGFTGQPNESFLYGVGNDAVNYMIDGVPFNDRYSSSLNLNLIQSEDVDSIEVVPLPRGFLFGNYNKITSLNFITKDFITPKPYTRIRFYQGANRDLMLDGRFNALVMKHLIASFEITNRIYDGTYLNTDYSIWQGKIKLKYLWSNNINIIASYNFNDYNAGYSGGVNVDSITARGDNVDAVMYNFREAPMLYPSGNLKTLTHLPRLRFLINPIDWLKTDASLFFLYNKHEKNASGYEYSENKTYGLNIRNDVSYNEFYFQLNINYEKTKSNIGGSYFTNLDSFQQHNYQNDLSFNYFSMSGVLSANLIDSCLIPSVYFKTSSFNNEFIVSNEEHNIRDAGRIGWGADLSLKLNANLHFYFGFSNVRNSKTNDLDYYQAEIGTNVFSKFAYVNLKYFINNYNYKIFIAQDIADQYVIGDVSGVGLSVKLNYGKLLLESNSSYYYASNKRLIGVPDLQTQLGLYYTGIVFNNNLDLKTGFVFYYTGDNNVFTYEHGVVEVPTSNRLDFTLAGEIQKTAVIYFVWQNLFNNNYYITPYYPMPTRTIRFGVTWEMFN